MNSSKIMHFPNEMSRAYKRLRYYQRGIVHHMTPYFICRRSTERLLQAMKMHPDFEKMDARANYYNKIEKKFDASAAPKTNEVDKSSSRYFLDLDEHLRGFGPQRHLWYLFGDVITIPDLPTVTKSRPISSNNQNSVILNLDKFRHFSWEPDHIPFCDKKPMAVWRGSAHTDRRIDLIEKFYSNPLCDIGHVSGTVSGLAAKPRLTHFEQKNFKFFISLEGVDVATSLKWAMASNMLVMSPKLEFETWFMEGALEPGKHFVLLENDFSDLEEKIAYYIEHADEAEAIIEHAHKWIAQFGNPLAERMISARVLEKYFAFSDQDN